ncbi:MAG: hypothetical protein WCC30_01085 [Candidatus Dormiibacterota bacterium]
MIVWIAVAFLILVILFRGPAAFPSIWVALVLVGLVGGAVVGAKALNARVVITQDYVESGDALRRLDRGTTRQSQERVVTRFERETD